METRVQTKIVHEYSCSTIHNGQKSEITQMSSKEWVNKMWYAYVIKYYSTTKKKNEVPIFATVWINLLKCAK